MGAHNQFVAGDQVQGVVFHERSAAGQAFGHLLHDGVQSSGFPVAFAAVADALSHQVLSGNTGQLTHTYQILEGVGEGREVVFCKELLHGNLAAGLIANAVDVVGVHVILGGVLRHLGVHFLFGASINGLSQVAYRIGVAFPAQFDFDFHLVAFGDANVTHVVAETADLQFLTQNHAGSAAHPGSDPLGDFGIFPVAHNNLPVHAQTAGHKAGFTVTVSGLVQVHEVHVHGVVGDFFVVLGVQVQQRLVQLYQALDPHLGGGEGMGKDNHTGASVAVVDFFHHLGDFFGAGHHALVDDFAGQAKLIHLADHVVSVLDAGLDGVIPVQGLGTGDKPEFQVF